MDIDSFYPSITSELLDKAFKFAREQDVFVSKEDQDIVTHSCMSFLFTQDGQPWIKKLGDSNFDVTMGSYAGAELSELVGLFLLSKVTKELLPKHSVGLYRDDGLCVTSESGPGVERIRKKLIQLFQEEGLKITVECNIQTTDFLDTLLNLKTGNHHPFRKPNDRAVYVHTGSSHPPSVIKQLPKMISSRISQLSSSADIFNSEIGYYRDALQEAGHKDLDFVYEPASSSKRKRQRKRRITYFNPPWNSEVKSNVGEMFLKIVDKHLVSNRNPKIRRFLNRATIKVSYCTTRNMQDHLSSHNKAILTPRSQEEEKCNCRKDLKPVCPLPGKCTTKEVVYKADIAASDGSKMTYFGLTENSFKTRYGGHKTSINNEKYSGQTELSKYVWKLKSENKDFNIQWAIKTRAFAFKSGSTRCDLCLSEKTTILLADPKSTINKRNEIISKCPHKRKFMLARFL